MKRARHEPEPERGVLIARLDKIRDTYATERATMTPTTKPVPQAVFTCTTCDVTTPVGREHICVLNGKQLRKLAAWKAQRRAERTPEKCGDCHRPVEVGGHRCTYRADKSLPAPVDGLVESLRAAGYRISKDG